LIQKNKQAKKHICDNYKKEIENKTLLKANGSWK